MSVRYRNAVINLDNVNNLEHLTIDLDNDVECNLGLFSLSIRDFKIINFVKKCLHDGNGCTINFGTKL